MPGWRQVYDRQPPVPQYQGKGFAEELFNARQAQARVRILATAWYNPASVSVDQEIAFVIRATVAQDRGGALHDCQIDRLAVLMPYAEDATHQVNTLQGKQLVVVIGHQGRKASVLWPRARMPGVGAPDAF